MHNKAMKKRPQKAWAGLANARLLLQRYILRRVWSQMDRVFTDNQEEIVEYGLEKIDANETEPLKLI